MATRRRCFLSTAAALLVCAPAAGAELQIQFSAIQRALASQPFTQDGRFWLSGAPGARCRYAYLEKPTVGGLEGRLQILGRFTGRSAVNLFGACVGLGDSFQARITAVPYCEGASLALRQVRVDSLDKDGWYVRQVRKKMAESLSAKFRYSLEEQARKLLEQTPPGAPYRRELTRLEVSRIRVTEQAIVVTLDFSLAVK